MKKILLSPWLALLTLSLLIAIRIIDPSFIESIRLRYFDTLITSKPVTQSKQVHVVNIDDKAIERLGQFPFPRTQYANIIEDLYARGAGLVVFNMFMPDNDRFGKDAGLADTLSRHPVVLPQVATYEKQKPGAFRPGVSEIGGKASDFVVNYPGIQANIESFNSRGAGIGVVNVLPEIDGVVRRIPMVVASEGQLYPSITLETLRVAVGDPSFQVKSTDAGIEAVRIPKFAKITTDRIGRVWVDWSSSPIEHSLVDLPKSLDGGIVIVGLTARGLNNPVSTARGAIYPHYLQASVLDTLTSGTSISRPVWADGAEMLGLVLLSIIAILLTRWTYGFIPVIAIIGGIYFGSRYIFQGHSFLLDASFPIVGLILVYVHSYTVKFLSELNQKLQIKKQFGSYVSPIIVERGLGEKYGADVEGFTAIMNQYMTAIAQPVFKNDGCLIKFIGDASLHIHGAPLDDDKHAYHAVKTTLEMIEAVEEFNKHLESIGKPPVGMGAGVNTGKILVGNIGSEGKMGYDVLGDPVSVAARLESQTKSYGVLMILGPDTAEAVKDDFDVVWLDNIAVKGKTVGLDIYTVGKTIKYKHEEYRKEWIKAYQQTGMVLITLQVSNESSHNR
ncbi:adenylate/guanylate cyclase domain-containing protein [bacterium]|nr:adenylate/guanylate cyclase domain-containing protein [bacterium]